MKKLLCFGVIFILTACELLANTTTLQPGHVYTRERGKMYDLTTQQATEMEFVEGYDAKTDTYIYYDDDSLWDDPMLYKVSATTGESELLLTQQQLDIWGEKCYNLESIQNGCVYVMTNKYIQKGNRSIMMVYLNQIDIITGKVLRRWDVSNKLNYVRVCNDRVFYDKKINGKLMTVENVNNKEIPVIEGTPFAFYKEYLLTYDYKNNSGTESTVIYAYNTKTNKKDYLVTLAKGDSYYFRNNKLPSSRPLYYIKNDKFYKAVPNGSNLICELEQKVNDYYQLVDVLETDKAYLISYLHYNDKEGYTKFLYIDKATKEKTVIFTDSIFLAYMPSLFYVESIDIDINNTIYFTAPYKRKLGGFDDVVPHSYNYNLETKIKTDVGEGNRYIFSR